MGTAEEFDRPTRDDVQEDRISALEKALPVRAQRPMSSEGHTQADLRDAQTRVLEAGQHQLSMQIADFAITAQEAAKWRVLTEERLAGIESALLTNTAITVEVRDVLSALKGGMKVLGWLGTALKWLGSIAVAVSAIYTGIYMLTHGGHLPGSGK